MVYEEKPSPSLAFPWGLLMAEAATRPSILFRKSSRQIFILTFNYFRAILFLVLVTIPTRTEE
jgi:hypothetical protein